MMWHVNPTPDTTTPEVERLAIPYDLFCQECAYNLRGLTSNRCPECGNALDALRSQESRIPWAHRDKLGWLRAYWKTVFWVGFQYRRFCEEVAREVDYAAAQRFRWITIAFAFFPLMGLASVLLLRNGNQLISGLLGNSLPVSLVIALVGLVILLGLIAMTGVPSYLFDVREMPVRQRNSAIAMSYYCGAALSWMPLPAAFGAASVLIPGTHETATGILLLASIFLPIAQLTDWWLNLARTAERVMPQYPVRSIVVALATPALWAIAVVATVVGTVLAGAAMFYIQALLQ